MPALTYLDWKVVAEELRKATDLRKKKVLEEVLTGSHNGGEQICLDILGEEQRKVVMSLPTRAE